MSFAVALRSGRLPCGAVKKAAIPAATSAIAVQARGYAAPAKPTKKTASKFRSNAKNEQTKSAPRDPGLFRPMAASALTDPIFQSDQRTPLQLPTFRAETITPEVANTAMAFPTEDSKALKAYGLPTNVLVDYLLLSKPCSVIRQVTVDVLNELDKAAGSSSANARLVFTGKPGCGKSYVLLQAVQYSVQKEWISFYIPRAINLVNSSTPYTYDPRTQTYGQPAFAQQLLKRFVDVNEALIQGMKVQRTYPFEERTIDSTSSLMDLINLGLEVQQQAPTVINTLLTELSEQTKFPVLLAIDDFQALYCVSHYRDPFYKAIKAYHLSLPRTLLEFASGKRSLQRGAVLGALSTQNTTFRAPLELVEALGLEPTVPSNPYVRREPELVAYASGLRNFPVPDKLTVDEAASIFEVWQSTKALHITRGDETFLSKYTEAGGNAREFVQKSLLQTVAM
ncbi:mitochondrial ribosomal death-associated protein 3-domain-containing protein [Daedaleopsis nitida]|nr:mitochondrial ribosomal death-associated protein 3-domain-containing protein [Daedaleopsis nitida]